MQLTHHDTPNGFLATAQSWLERDEPANPLMLGLALRLRSSPVPCHLITIMDDGDLALAALMTPPYPLTLYSPHSNPHEAVFMLSRYLHDRHTPVSAVSGQVPLPEQFAQVWIGLSGLKYTARMHMRTYQLRQVIHPRPIDGHFRVAGEEDGPLLVGWMRAFIMEALHDESASAAATQTQLRVRDRELFVWEQDGKPVSMAGKARPTMNGITVNMVYTPPQHRGKGYATACVAALSQHLIDEGWKYCTLFADLANPISNGIYQRIGYQPVCDFDEIALT